MSRVAVLTDSNSGITQEEGKKLGIGILPMPFFIDGEEYFEESTGRCNGIVGQVSGGV